VAEQCRQPRHTCRIELVAEARACPDGTDASERRGGRDSMKEIEAEPRRQESAADVVRIKAATGASPCEVAGERGIERGSCSGNSTDLRA
jgi:hypothetical protein